MVKPLSLIFKNCIQYRIFPNLWKKSNIVSIHKKGDKQCMVNYRAVSLLPICGNIFERLIFNPVFEFLEENKFSPNQSSFRPNDACENQLLPIVHGIYADCDQSPSLEVRANFLDISKAFHKVWHERLINKLDCWNSRQFAQTFWKFPQWYVPEGSSQRSVLKLVTSPGRSSTGLKTCVFTLLGIYRWSSR